MKVKGLIKKLNEFRTSRIQVKQNINSISVLLNIG